MHSQIHAMEINNQVKHLYARAGFGLRFEDFKYMGHQPIKTAVNELFKASMVPLTLNVVQGDLDYDALLKGDVMGRKMMLKQQREQEKELNIAWINQLCSTRAQLSEKMTLFWNNHFACRSRNAVFAQQLNNVQRANALGNFRQLVLAVSKSPAMLQFLNNQQNHKGHPNENFARELMELFTIGQGNYTEQDVKESARAFTGWGFTKDGDFKARPNLHDDGQKTFLGKTGNFNGDDIISILLERKETAYFISNKLYKYLVNEVPDPAHVNAMADVFYQANYEIKPLLTYIFNADWFYYAKNTGNLVKSPVDLIVGLSRRFYVSYQKPEVLLEFQRTLGQILFYPPNVAGWPGGRNWIDSSSLMYRLKIPSVVLNGGLIDFSGKADPEDEAYIASGRVKQSFVNTRVQSQPDWNRFLQELPKNTTKKAMAQFILEPKLSGNIMDAVTRAPDIKTMMIELASTPEYQLC